MCIRDRRCSNMLQLTVALLVYLASAITLGESVQALEKMYDEPLATRWLMMSSTLILIPMAEVYSCGARCRDGLWYKQSSRWRFVMAAGVVTALTYGGGVTFVYSLKGASVTTVGALTRTKPVLIYMISVIFLSEQVTWSSLLAVLFSIGGCAFFVLGAELQDDHENGTQETTTGVVLGALTPVCWAVSDIAFGQIATGTFDKNQLLRDSMYLQGLTGVGTLLSLIHI
eukprot:TRINITY_DN33209_c0_g1_i1.p1 TRINITY_DN33209_c0_g1~~TRINITY_DN33209_c0_g1_i1.p1  ORF type:complete len:228 (+),score=53.53 TRINITY_DN33209_c0_g1_i1:128-811(+)